MSLWKTSISVSFLHLTRMINVGILSFLLLPGLKLSGSISYLPSGTQKWQQLAWVNVHTTVPEGNLLVYLFLNHISKMYPSPWRHRTKAIFQYSSQFCTLASHTKLLKTQYLKKWKRLLLLFVKTTVIV